MGAFPGSLSEGAAERSEAEGVYFGERKRSKLQSLYEPVGKSLAWRNHRGTLPQSRPFGRASSLREGAGVGLYHSTCRSETATLRAIFIAPTKLKSFYISPFIGGHSLSLAFARQLPQRGSRDAGCTIQRAARKPQRCGRFSSPLRNSKVFTFHHSSGGRAPMYGNQLKA